MILASAVFIWLTLTAMHALAVCSAVVAPGSSPFGRILKRILPGDYFKLGQDVNETQ